MEYWIGLPFCANHALQQTKATQGVPSERAIVNSITSNIYTDECIDLYGKDDRTKEHVVELAERPKKDGFYLTKWTINDSRASANKPSNRIYWLEVFTTQVERTLGLHWVAGKLGSFSN